jgi:uncharacterized protein
MIAIVSSAKTLDFELGWKAPETTQPECLAQARALLAQIKPLPAAKLGKLLGVSPKLAALNAERLSSMSFPFTPRNAKLALLAYQGEVFRSMGSGDLSAEDLLFAQGSLRIVSGLFGLLRPLDLIQPYRLEMAAKLSGPSWKDLRAFWSDRVTAMLSRDAQANGKLIVNLASQEYASVFDRKKLSADVLTIHFKQSRKGKVEMVPILAKRARGLMARFLVKNRVENAAALKKFNADGYQFNAALSVDNEWIFLR